MCLCKGGGGLLIRRGPGLTVIVDHVDISDDLLVIGSSFDEHIYFTKVIFE